MEQTIEFYDCVAREWRVVFRRWDGHYWRFGDAELSGTSLWSVRGRFEPALRNGGSTAIGHRTSLWSRSR